jgi:hypothetical protein
VNFKIDMQRVGLDFRKSGLDAAYWARVCRLEHVLSLRPMLIRCGLRAPDKCLVES